MDASLWIASSSAVSAQVLYLMDIRHVRVSGAYLYHLQQGRGISNCSSSGINVNGSIVIWSDVNWLHFRLIKEWKEVHKSGKDILEHLMFFIKLINLQAYGYNLDWRGWGTLEYCFIPNGGGFLFTQKYCNALFFRRAERNFEFLNSILGHLQLSFVVGYYLPNLSRDLVLHFDHSKVITLLVESG